MIESEPRKEKIIKTLKFINLTLAAYIAMGAIARGGQILDKQATKGNQNVEAQVK